MKPIQLFDPPTSTYTYILGDDDSRAAIIIDSVAEQLERDLAILTQNGLRLKWAVETHVHADHVTAAAALAERTGARMAVGANCGVEPLEQLRLLEDGDVLRFGSERLRALATPGHTAGSMCYTWEPQEPGARSMHVFTGDTLLIGGCGRTDFQSGDAGQLYDSITGKLFALPGDTTVWPGHDYAGQTRTTIALERAANPRLAGRTREQFIELMQNLDLAPPKRLRESVAANLRLGRPADPADEAASAGTADDVQAADGYAGELDPATAYAWMQEGRALLVDVRTDAERRWCGVIAGAQLAPWKTGPDMVPNPDFNARVQSLAAGGQPLMMLCQAGGRSRAAARRATELGLQAYNISGGFDGDLDAHGHRRSRNGWCHAGLPWSQQ